MATGRLNTYENEGDVAIGAPDEDGEGSATVLYHDERTPRTEAIRSAFAVAGGRFGAALDMAYGAVAIGAPGERHGSSAASGAGIAYKVWLGSTPTSTYILSRVAARGVASNAHLGSDVVLLRPRPIYGDPDLFAGVPDLDVDGKADAGSVSIPGGTLASPTAAAGEHAGAAVGG